MKPLVLSMQAFGPFPGLETIDFTALGKNPLFLINGPTGSGKTTILDAICFALYGKTTGDERDGTQMRCDLAAADLLTEVTLEFELAGRRYRLRRLPEQHRPKARGDGFTSQSPEAQLFEIDPGGEETLLVPSKVTEATRKVEELTGLSVDQFRQVMVLPQGKFRQLLLAESAEREKIFSQLFQTRIYRMLEERLKESSASIRRQRDELLTRRQGILEAASLESVEQLSQEREVLAPELEVALTLKQTQERNHQAATEQLEQGRALASQFQQLKQVQADLRSLQEKETDIARQRQQLQRAELASKLLPQFEELQRRQLDLQELTKRLEDCRNEQQSSAKALADAKQRLDKVQQQQPELDRLKQQLAELHGFRTRAEQLLTANTRLQKVTRRVSVAELKLNYKLLLERQLQHQVLIAQGKLCEDQKRLLFDLKQKGQQLAEAAERQQESAKQLELSWHRGQAAILASELQPGQPCPVCGSCEHPAPAPEDELLPTQQQVEQAREKARLCQLELLAARERYANEQSRMRELQAELGRLQEVSAETGPVASAEEELQQLQQQANDLQIALTAAGELELQTVAALEKDFTEAKDALLTAAAQVAAAEQELPEKFRQPGTLEAAEKQLQKQLEQLEKQLNTATQYHQQALEQSKTADATLAATSQQQQQAEDVLQQALDRWKSGLQESAFSSEDDFQSAVLGDAELKQVRQRLENFDRNIQQLNGAREQLSRALQETQRPDLDDLERKLQAATQQRTTAAEAWQQLDKRSSLLDSTAGKLSAAELEMRLLDDRYAVVGTLSDVANGQTGKKISLQRFVLSVLLDDVLIEASQRLSLMSKGRYQLLRKEDRSKGNKASGLELEVEDAYTGKVRPVATLSGGESFMAALALALGLSDVVQAYAGGIRLDTLFIDEGFGSLDPESLELAVRTLVDLQTSGRMVGVISHVAELKEQLPLRIDVGSGRLGSCTRLICP